MPQVSINLNEPVCFTGGHHNGLTATMVRALLSLDLPKATKVTSIDVSLVAKFRTEWPEGLPPSYTAHAEEHVIVSTQNILHSDKLVMALRAVENTSPSPASSGAYSPRGRFSNVSQLLRGATQDLREWSNFAGTPSSDKEEYTELPKGVYTCPIVFTLPPDTPPSMNLSSGGYSYRLTAEVHRYGTFSSKLTATTPLTVVMLPDEEDVCALRGCEERKWQDQLLYAVHTGVKQFHLGGRIPFQLTMVPLEKLAVHSITVSIEEKATYHALGRRLVNTEPIRRFPLLSIKQPYWHGHAPILPILPDSPPNTLSLFQTPTSIPHIPRAGPSHDAPGIVTSESDYIDQLHNVGGPWCLRHSLLVPDADAGLHFTYDQHPDSEIIVEHDLKVVIAVYTTRPESTNTAGTLQYVTVTFPIQIFSHLCSPELTNLPSYADTAHGNMATSHYYHSSPYHERPSPSSALLPPLPTPSEGMRFARTPPNPTDVKSASQNTIISTKSNITTPSGNISTSGSIAAMDYATRSHHFARLIAGEEGVDGELPPAYSRIADSPPRDPASTRETLVKT